MRETLTNIFLSLALAGCAFFVGALIVAFAVYRLALGDLFYFVVLGSGVAVAIWAFMFSFRKLNNP